MNQAASALSKQRWSKPEHVQIRVDRLAEHIARKVATLPPLTDEQKATLREAFAPALDPAATVEAASQT